MSGLFKSDLHEAAYQALVESGMVAGEGFVLAIAEIASDAVQSMIFESTDEGIAYFWMCPRCGQPLAKGECCNSGIHQGPSDDNEGVEAVRSIDVVR